MIYFPYKNNPTTDIYFAAPLHDLIAKPVLPNANRPIRRIGPNCFYANHKAIIIRYITAPELKKLEQLSPKQVFYIIDDDFHALETDNSLPQDYRNRLKTFTRVFLPELLSVTDTIIAPNPIILANYPDKRGELLHPSATAICGDFSHFDNTKEVKILFSGTRSHLNDLVQVKGSILEICAKFPEVRFTTFMGNHAPDTLLDHPNIIHHKALSWGRYKKRLKTERFHIALAPLAKTKFNLSRSINKIYDHAAFGAAGIYTDFPPINTVVKSGKSGFLIEQDPQAWTCTMENLIVNLEKARAVAKAGCKLANSLGKPDIVRRFWLKRLFA